LLIISGFRVLSETEVLVSDSAPLKSFRQQAERT